MSILESKISLQQSRFNLIQAADYVFDNDITPVTRQFINTRLEMLKKIGLNFKDMKICHSTNDALSDHPYIKTRLNDVKVFACMHVLYF